MQAPTRARGLGLERPAAVDSGLVSFIIVSWNTRELTRSAIMSVLEHASGTPHEVIVVDNGSADGTVDMIGAEFPQVRVLANEANLGFGTANNQAMRVASGQYFFLLNSDAQLLSPVQPCAQFLERSGAGLAGCRLTLPGGGIQASCRRFPSLRLSILEGLLLYKLLPAALRARILLGGYWLHDHSSTVDWVTAAAVLVRREVFAETGGFDERIFMYGEDLEWCMRIRDAGWPIVYFHDCVVAHHAHASGELEFGRALYDVCHGRLYQIMQRREGTAYTGCLFAVNLVAALIRSTYFAGRVILAARKDPHLVDQLGYYRGALHYHLRALRHGWA